MSARLLQMADAVARFRAVSIGIAAPRRRHVVKNTEQKKAKHEETVSDQEIWLAIRYLDPDIERKVTDIAVITTLLALFSIICIVWLLLRLRGL